MTKEKETPKIFTGLGIVILIAVTALAGVIGEEIANEYFNQKDKVVVKQGKGLSDKLLMEISNKINKNLPMMIDKNTRIDSTLGFNNKLTYRYTLVNLVKKDLDIETWKRDVLPMLKNSVCTSEDLKIFFIDGVTIVYSYSDKKGRFLSKFLFNPPDCGY